MKRIPVALDFETRAIGSRPARYPPRPVGLAVYERGKDPHYLAWGHPIENNCTAAKAERVLRRYCNRSRYNTIWHNAKFDLEVAYEWFGIPMPDSGTYETWDDTMFMLYLVNPRSKNLRLKDNADLLLGMPPDEQQELRDWVLDNVPGARRAKEKWGAHIAKAPGKLVGKYAVGDVVRTMALYDHLLPIVRDQDMVEAYEREKRLMPTVVDMERQGVHLDIDRLEQDTALAKKDYRRTERRILRQLGDINIDSGEQLANALERKNLVTDWEYTDKGNRRTGRESLQRCCTDPKLVQFLGRHSRLSKIIGTYMDPWLESGREHNGVFYPWFNQVRGDNGYGTKTGRFSSNFQQIPKEPDDTTLPYMRNYVVADATNQILLDRDFSQQEIRILAYYEHGILYDAFMENPNLDVHALVGELIEERTGVRYPRSHIKITNFGVIYGSGVPATAKRLGIDRREAGKLLRNHKKALPGVKDLMRGVSNDAKQGRSIRTIGGRIYEPEFGFEYKLLNNLIQGGAADHTKESMIRLSDAIRAGYLPMRLMFTVHDQFIASTPKRGGAKTMKTFREVMDDDNLFDIPMLSDGKVGYSWGDMENTK